MVIPYLDEEAVQWWPVEGYHPVLAVKLINDLITEINLNTSPYINVKAYGATGDGVTDDWPAFVLARAASIALGLPFYMPTGTYKLVVNDPAGFVLWTGALIFGDGMGKTFITWNDDDSIDELITYPSIGARISNVELRDFTVLGSAADTPGAPFNIPVIARNVDNLRYLRLGSTQSRSYGLVARQCDNVLVDGCSVYQCQSGGISVAGCSNYTVVNNSIDSVDDDGIDAHTQVVAASPLDSHGVISSNRMTKCQGIKVLGATSLDVIGNVLEFCYGDGIDVRTQAAGGTSEGDNAGRGVAIVGNTIRNHLNRQYIDNLNQSGWYIVISGASARAGTLDAVPSYNVTGTGAIISPYPYYLNNSATSTVPIPPSGSVIIANNVLERTVEPTAFFSDYGYGEFFTRNGPVNPEVVAEMLTGTHSYGMEVRGGIMSHVFVSSNQFLGMGGGIQFDTDPEMSSMVISKNLFFDLPLGAIVLPNGSDMAESKYVDDNVFDLDPYYTNSGRNVDGTWDAADNLTALFYNDSKGWVTRRNVFRNCSRVSTYNTQTDTVNFWQDNILEGQPAAVGFSASNKGMGDFIRGPDFKTRIVDCDPTSATFRQILNEPILAANTIPATGTHVAGAFVWNSVPGLTAGITTLGWSRLTTGANNVLGTDWSAIANVDAAAGTFTPTLTFGGAAVGITGTLTGHYARVGTMVLAQGTITLTSKGSSTGNCEIGGLPFTADAFTQPVALRIFDLGATVGDTFLSGAVIASTLTIQLYKEASGLASRLTDADFNNTTTVNFSASYLKA